jgi:hypothetical protein
MPDTRTPEPGDIFLAGHDISDLFDSAGDGIDAITPQMRFVLILKKTASLYSSDSYRPGHHPGHNREFSSWSGSSPEFYHSTQSSDQPIF